jgi:hypothetical protein
MACNSSILTNYKGYEVFHIAVFRDSSNVIYDKRMFCVGQIFRSRAHIWRMLRMNCSRDGRILFFALVLGKHTWGLEIDDSKALRSQDGEVERWIRFGIRLSLGAGCHWN